MIAPIRQTDPQRSKLHRRLHRARRVIAQALLEEPSESARRASPVGAAAAWTFALWVVAVAAAWLTRMLGVW